MIAVNHPLQFYVDKIEHREPFAFSRFGDGEWYAILGKEGKNCDGHEYFPQMGIELRQSLHSDYYHTVSPVARRLGQDVLDNYLKEQGLSDMEWHPGNVFVKASLRGELRPLITAMRNIDLIYVGPGHLRPFVAQQFPRSEFLAIPQVNCYLQKEAIIAEVMRMARGRFVLVGFSASMAANVIIDKLFRIWGKRNIMIDFGSLFDPYAGVRSRSYMRGMKIIELKQINFGE